jgi:hypothetical protein
MFDMAPPSLPNCHPEKDGNRVRQRGYDRADTQPVPNREPTRERPVAVTDLGHAIRAHVTRTCDHPQQKCNGFERIVCASRGVFIRV